MAAPNTLIVSYISSYTAGVGSANATVTLTIRTGEDYNASVHNIFLEGGFWFTPTSTGVLTFIPWGEITSITAQ
jgi:hypothetical protein